MRKTSAFQHNSVDTTEMESLFHVFSSSSPSSDSPFRAFPYEHPTTVHLLTLLSLLYLLIAVATVADRFIYGGIIAQISLGMIYGSPLANILPLEWEATFSALGFIGLIGIVFEGGLGTDPAVLFSNLILSTVAASVGVILPIALSMGLFYGAFGYTPLAGFAAGVALSTTSLGTTLMTLTSLNKSQNDARASREIIREKTMESTVTVVPPLIDFENFRSSRIVTVLIGTAMIDDVIGLVLASLIPALAIQQAATEGGSNSNMTWTIIRPLLSSFLLSVITPIVARFVLRPLYRRAVSSKHVSRRKVPFPTPDHIKLCIMILFVYAFIGIAYYTGSSLLFGAYLAGITVAYMGRADSDADSSDVETKSATFEEVFKKLVGPVQHSLLVPLFFASIGHAIPFTSLWRPAIMWKGVIYAILMTVGKVATGIPITCYSILFPGGRKPKSPAPAPEPEVQIEESEPSSSTVEERGHVSFSRSPTKVEQPPSHTEEVVPRSPFRASLYPALFMGTAMVARGEIGLLIAQIGRGSSTVHGLLNDDAYLLCIWAILLCTLVGPITAGWMLNRYGPKINQGIWS